ncbi:38483_t:CDS:1, partial [Gigaspora margarita]
FKIKQMSDLIYLEIKDENIQAFENLTFKIKLTTISGSRNSACLSFLNHNNDKIQIPDGIELIDITNINFLKVPAFPEQIFFT